MALFTIGTVVALEDPTNFKVMHDDRVAMVPCISGSYLEDLGYNAAGAAFEVDLVVTESDYQALIAYRAAKTKPSITDHRGTSLGARAFRIKETTYVDGLAYRTVRIEILKG